MKFPDFNIIGILSVLLGLVFVYFIFFHLMAIITPEKRMNFFSCRHYSEILNQEYVGIVEKKYVDHDNHENKTLVINNKDDVIILNFFNSNLTDLFDIIEESDSIIKRPRSSKVKIIKGNKIIHSEIRFYCDSLLLRDTHLPFGGIFY